MSACNLLNVFTGLVLQTAVWIQLHPCVDHGKAEKTDDLPYTDLSQICTKQLKMKNHWLHIFLLLTLKVIALSAVDLQRLWSLAGRSLQVEHTCFTVVFAVFLHGFHLPPPEMTTFLADWKQQWALFVSEAAKIVLVNKLKGLVTVPKFPPWLSKRFFLRR